MSMTSEQFTPYSRAMITIAVMMATLMQVLDTTIVNVALPHMEGSLGASPDQISWVLTSYLVASAIFMPLTGYFSDWPGQKKYLLISISGFVLASMLCGIAVTINQLVLFRLLQGAFGAALVPLSQAILTDIYPEKDRGKAMAIWSIGVMIGPVLGPTVGGYLTDVASWRWNFYINIPIGIVCLLLTWQAMPDSIARMRKMDWIGLLLLSTSIGATQYFLDRGNQADWFNSGSICIAAFLAVICLLLFLFHGLGKKSGETLFDLRIFQDRNFVIATGLLAVFCLGLYGAMVVLPLMLEGLFNYPVMTTGLVMAPRGIGAMFSMMVVGKLIKTVDPRLLIAMGVIFCVVGMAAGTYYNLDISYGWVIGPLIIQGLGLGMVFVPLSAVAFSTLPASTRADAAGLFSLLRTIGGSAGISAVVTLYARHTQMSWNQLGGHITPYQPAVLSYLQHLNLSLTSSRTGSMLAHTLGAQAQMVSFVTIFAFIAWSFVLMLPLVLLLKKAERYEHVMAGE